MRKKRGCREDGAGMGKKMAQLKLAYCPTSARLNTGDVVVGYFRFPTTALFAFDNASNYCCYAPDALLASAVKLNPGGKQSLMRNGYNHRQGLSQSMVFPENYPNIKLRGKAKGAEVVL